MLIKQINDSHLYLSEQVRLDDERFDSEFDVEVIYTKRFNANCVVLDTTIL